MARLDLRIEGEKVGASKVLLAASSLLKMLKAVERDVTGKKQATIPWEVTIVTTSVGVFITLRSEGDEVKAIAFETTQKALARMEVE